MENEIWKPLQIDDVKLFVSNRGRVKWERIKLGGQWVHDFIKDPLIDKDGYCHHRFMAGGKFRKILVHRAVAENFIPNPDKWFQVFHLDGDKSNNAADNLAWSKTRTNKKRNPNAKLDDKKVEKIKTLLKNGDRVVNIAEKFDVSPSLVSRIKKGERWNSGHTKKMHATK